MMLNRWISVLSGALVRSNPNVVIIHAKVLAFLAQVQAAEQRLQDIEMLLNDDHVLAPLRTKAPLSRQRRP